jgi:hypothetical protein
MKDNINLLIVIALICICTALTFLAIDNTAQAGGIEPISLLEMKFKNHLKNVPIMISKGDVRVVAGFEIRSETPTHFWYINEYLVGDRRFKWEGRYNKETKVMVARIMELDKIQRRLDVVE